MRTIVLTTVQVGQQIAHVASVNEPNKIQVAELVSELVGDLKLEGQLSYEEYLNLGHGDKGYIYSIGGRKAIVEVKRLPLNEFSKQPVEYSFD
jgi:hypothetical protein